MSAPQEADVLAGGVLGLTLAEYAAALRTHPQAARDSYRRLMREDGALPLPPVTRRQDDGDVIKFCIGAGPSGKGWESESVIIPMNSYRGSSWRTLCLSSQIGCRMGCTFCETASMGLLRNLSAAEIVRQRIVARRIMLENKPPPPHWSYFGDGIQNIVFMGMGEPLDNLDEVVQAVRVLSEPAGLDFPKAQITISTVGRIDGLRALAELQWPNLRIAVSLTAPTDALRDQLVPVNKAMPLADLQRALLDYPLARRGYFLIEYVLINGVNDAPEHADAVAEWCRPLRCIVNLIPYNPQRDAQFEAPSDDTVLEFLRRLRSRGVFVKRRITHGRDLMGACGQMGNPAVRRAAMQPAAVRKSAAVL